MQWEKSQYQYITRVKYTLGHFHIKIRITIQKHYGDSGTSFSNTSQPKNTGLIGGKRNPIAKSRRNKKIRKRKRRPFGAHRVTPSREKSPFGHNKKTGLTE